MDARATTIDIDESIQGISHTIYDENDELEAER